MCAVAPSGESVEFVPNDGFTGETACTYKAFDSRDVCGDATIFLTILDQLSTTSEEPKSLLTALNLHLDSILRHRVYIEVH